jgi:GTP cyclohydrolase II
VKSSKSNTTSLEKCVISRIPTVFGEFQLHLYSCSSDRKEHLALVMEQVSKKLNVLVCVHFGCFTGEVLALYVATAVNKLNLAMQKIAEEVLFAPGRARHRVT